MPPSASAGQSRAPLWLAVTASGAAGLTWETLWQTRVATSLGVSATSAAVTLASTMLGLAVGAFYVGRLATRGRITRPLFAYGIAEGIVGVAGLAVSPMLELIAALDGRLYAASPTLAQAGSLAATALTMVLPAAAMGATMPLLAAAATGRRTHVGTLYAINTAGAVAGLGIVTFVLLPSLGLFRTELVAAGVDLAVMVWALTRSDVATHVEASSSTSVTSSLSPEGRARLAASSAPRVPGRALAVAFASGLAVFVLEVSWFRSIRAAYQSTTESFAIVLAAFLAALATGAWIARPLRRVWPKGLPFVLAFASVGIVVATPLVDALDLWVTSDGGGADVQALRFARVLAIVAAPIVAQGIALPWLLDESPDPPSTARLYAVNTVGAVSGALLAAFVALPALGATTTSWLAAVPGALAAIALAPSGVSRVGMVMAGALAAFAAVSLDVGTARERVHGFGAGSFHGVLYVREDPDSTVWVTTARRTHERQLVIDGFIASGEGVGEHYMRWMGHLPALATPALDRALVICFGTGQTANAVREHAPGALDIADVSRAVLDAAPMFPANRGVLRDHRVRAVVMDGRAFLRRASGRRYDLVTLEPMPPNFAGSNALYARELYELARLRLAPRGVVAQWVPFHLVSAADMKAIVATFHETFPHARLWIDPVSETGILLGGTRPFALRPARIALDLTDAQVRDAFELDTAAVRRLAAGAAIITDDNQLLSYGPSRFERYRRGRTWHRRVQRENLRIARAAARAGASP